MSAYIFPTYCTVQSFHNSFSIQELCNKSLILKSSLLRTFVRRVSVLGLFCLTSLRNRSVWPTFFPYVFSKSFALGNRPSSFVRASTISFPTLSGKLILLDPDTLPKRSDRGHVAPLIKTYPVLIMALVNIHFHKDQSFNKIWYLFNQKTGGL